MEWGAIAQHSLWLSIYCFGAFFVAAFSKGVTGLGFSTLCLPLLAIALPPTVSIPLVIVPSLCSNVLVILGAGEIKPALQRFWPVYLAALPGLGLGLLLLNRVDNAIGRGVLGGVLILYAIWALVNRESQLQPAIAKVLALPVGFTTGVVNGLTGSQVMPILPYLLSLELEKDAFVTAINVSFTLSSVVMLFGLSRFGLIQLPMLAIALVGTLFVALGINLGGYVRRQLEPDVYKKLILGLLILLGVGLLWPLMS